MLSSVNLVFFLSAIHAPDFRQELNDLIAKEQQKLKDFVLEQTRDQKQQLVDYVRQQQVISLMSLLYLPRTVIPVSFPELTLRRSSKSKRRRKRRSA